MQIVSVIHTLPVLLVLKEVKIHCTLSVPDSQRERTVTWNEPHGDATLGFPGEYRGHKSLRWVPGPGTDQEGVGAE